MDIVTKFCQNDNDEIYTDAFYIRVKVFVEEQGISLESERDEFDSTAYHFVSYFNSIPIACARMNIKNNEARICRVAVLKPFRCKGIASKLCAQCMAIARQNKVVFVYLNAQVYVSSLYEKIGFSCVGNIFLEENIPHIRMVQTL